MSYFAKPNFIIYDEWFDDDLEKTKLDVKNKSIKKISNIHDFFYEQSNYKVGASENILQHEMNKNEKKLIINEYIKKTSGGLNSASNKHFRSFKKLAKRKLKFLITKKLIYSLSILSFILIFGFLIFFNSQGKKNQSNFANQEFFTAI